MDDLISRQAAIDAIGALSDAMFKNIEKGATFPKRQWFDGMANAESIIKDLPSVQPETHWIPCSERLPEKPCYCLTSNEYSNVCEDFYWGEDSFEKANKYHYEVLAWMPFPEPYKGGETE